MIKKFSIYIFTDLDASLIHRDTFEFDEIKNYIKNLISGGINIIPNTSKTEIEINEFNNELGFNLPYISENGSSITGLDLINKNFPNKINLSRGKDDIYKIFKKVVPENLRAKCKVISKMEKKIEQSGLNYTVFQCSGFFQGLISQYALPILENETIWLPSDSAPLAYLDTQDAAKAVVQTLNTSTYDSKKVSLIGEKFWTPKEIIQLCERLSGKTANISYIPVAAFTVLRGFFRLFEFTWNIADRLQFGEIANDTSLSIKPTNEVSWPIKRLGLESYLQEYFGKILKKLRETNYQQSQKSDEISFS